MMQIYSQLHGIPFKPINAWIEDAVGWCYLDENGRMIVNRTIFVDGHWYAFNSNGYWVA